MNQTMTGLVGRIRFHCDKRARLTSLFTEVSVTAMSDVDHFENKGDSLSSRT